MKTVQEFVVRPVRDRAHWQLMWMHYAVRTCNRYIFCKLKFVTVLVVQELVY